MKKLIYTILSFCLLANLATAQKQDSINLTAFLGVAVEQGIELLWKTNGEYNAKEFGVERSLDGVTFEPVKTMACKNNVTTEQTYRLAEDGIYRSVVYYRLKMVGTTTESYSNTIAVVRKDVEDLPAIMVFPTIVQDHINVFKNSDEDLTDAQIRIFNMSGQLVYSQSIQDDFIKINVPLADYARGAYVLEVRKGKFASKTKFVKQ